MSEWEQYERSESLRQELREATALLRECLLPLIDCGMPCDKLIAKIREHLGDDDEGECK